MNKPSVSVVIPITEENPFLVDTLKSIRKQTYKDTEIICSNAAGNRKLSHLLRSFAKHRKNVRIISSYKGNNLCVAFNAGALRAHGSYVARIDVGDIATKTRIAKQVVFLQEHPETVAVGGQRRLYKKYARANPKPLPLTHEDIYALSFLSLAINPSTLMVNKTKLPKSFRWYNQSLKHIQEFDLIFHLMSFGNLANLPETVSFVNVYRPLQKAFHWTETTVLSIRAIFLAITRYGMAPNAKTITTSTVYFLM
jgi:glycosyltransferase involved in cell wall biosynthesis